MSEMRSANTSNKQWLHPPDALSRGHVLYVVKFLGECEVESPKGTDVVKDAIRKRKFNKSLYKTEGQKTPKVELSISVDGVTIQEHKTKFVKHRYPLHRISYCADDKSDKRMFTFIAKAADSEKHFCYVFASERNAEEITLTIGQAFDLAYRRFLETQGSKEVDSKKQNVILHKKVEALEKENEMLRLRIKELELLKDRSDVDNYKRTKQQNSPKQSGAGRKLEYLVFDSSSPQPVTNGTTQSPKTLGMISPPPPTTRSRSGRPVTPSTPTAPQVAQQVPPVPPRSDLEELASVFPTSTPQQNSFNNNHVFDPFATPGASGTPQKAADPFGMSSFNPGQDQDFLDKQAGFSQGLLFGTEELRMDFGQSNNSMTDSFDHGNNSFADNTSNHGDTSFGDW